AAVRDMIRTLVRRFAPIRILLYPVAVQGAVAAKQIASALGELDKQKEKLGGIDLIIMGRGGGSLEDLWAFNEEVLARAIFDSKIPVISAVGHEIDTTIADLVADARASTPTKAGVIAVPDMQEILAKLASVENGLNSDIAWKIKTAKQNIETILAGAAFRNPFLLVRNREQVLDETQSQLVIAAEQLLVQLSNMLYVKQEQIRKIEPHWLLGVKKVDLNNLRNRAENVINTIVNKAAVRLAAVENRLAALNPKSVLRRGYSITTSKKTGVLVRNLADVQLGDCLITELGNKNLIESEVIKK
ncbi:MAG: exodeoxyribonuclease VII large subunit, partial [Planctomycetes bacterium]|nr:exodeoxyribonuclease VII large subunit [Planctomycetota bacterium]